MTPYLKAISTAALASIISAAPAVAPLGSAHAWVAEVSCRVRNGYLNNSHVPANCIPRHPGNIGYWYLGYSVNCYWFPNRPDCNWQYGWHWYPGYRVFGAWAH